MKILVSIIILFLSYQLIAEEVIVCELNELSNSTDWNFYNEGETTQENIKIPKYRYYIIDDINKKITHFKTLYINRGSGTFVYDEKCNCSF